MTRYGIRNLTDDRWVRRLNPVAFTQWPTQAVKFQTMSEGVMALIEADLDQDDYAVQPLPRGEEE